MEPIVEEAFVIEVLLRGSVPLCPPPRTWIEENGGV